MWRAGLACCALATAAAGQAVELGAPHGAAVELRAESVPPQPLAVLADDRLTPESFASLDADHGMAAAPRWAPRVSAAYFTRGPGYEAPYARLGGAVPLHAAAGRAPSLLFAEAAMLHDDRGLLGGSAGLAWRAAAPSFREAQGFGCWWEGRDLGPATLRRLGLSWDSLAPADETRFNVYVPAGAAQTRLSDQPTAAVFGSVVLPAVRTERLVALHGVELERGGLALGVPGKVSLWGFAGGYHQQGPHVPVIWGVMVRGELRFGDACGLSAQFQTDRVFGSRGFFGAEWQFPRVRPHGRGGDLQIEDLLYRPMRRSAVLAAARPTSLLFP